MATELDITGRWPSPVKITRGWARAEARTWNDDFSDAFVRLVRGSSAFLRDVSDRLVDLARARVYSPALLRPSSRVWVRSGYEPAFELRIMEHTLSGEIDTPTSPIGRTSEPDLDAIVAVDRRAFEPFWRMSAPGLAEALRSTKTSTTLVIEDSGRVAAYAMVGAQWGTAYLQRLAVDPDARGRGLGTGLVQASLAWALERAASKVVLNVKPDNERAREMYRRLGFSESSDAAHVYRYVA